MTSFFGEPDTPSSRPPQRELQDLSLIIFEAEAEAETKSVRLHAGATVAFTNAEAARGVKVGFYLNGRLLCAITTDEYGIATHDKKVPDTCFKPGDNRLTVRVASFDRSASKTFCVTKPVQTIAKETSTTISKVILSNYSAILDIRTGRVSLFAVVEIENANKTVAQGVSVTFFLNGRHLTNIDTDSFGRATLDAKIAAHSFLPGNNELTARISGLTICDSCRIQLVTRNLRITNKRPQWLKVIPVVCYDYIKSLKASQSNASEGIPWIFKSDGHLIRAERLSLEIYVECVGPPIDLKGVTLILEVHNLDGLELHSRKIVLDTNGRATFHIDDWFYDENDRGNLLNEAPDNMHIYLFRDVLKNLRAVIAYEGWLHFDYESKKIFLMRRESTDSKRYIYTHDVKKVAAWPATWYCTGHGSKDTWFSESLLYVYDVPVKRLPPSNNLFNKRLTVRICDWPGTTESIDVKP